jgi:hypothetical protein
MVRGNKKIFFISLVIAAIAAGYYFYSRGQKDMDSETIALVNGKAIFLSDFEERLSSIKTNYPPDKMANLPEMKQTILRRMIIEELILQDARENKIKVNSDELNREIKIIKQSYTEDEFNQLLLNQFKTYEDWTDEVRLRLIIEKTLSKEVVDKINVTEKELKEQYERFYANKLSEPKLKLAQVFTTSKENADKALEELKTGAVFDDVVKKYSEAPEASKGGVVRLS